MFGQIVRLLWNNRKHNLWIMVEMIVISVVCWMVMDPIFVLNYNRLLPDGYESDGLYRLQLMQNREDTTSIPREDYERIMQKLRSHPLVDAATCVLRGAYPSSPGNNTNVLQYDTLQMETTYIPFFRHSQFFRTWRFRSAVDGTWETLENLEVPDDGAILTADLDAMMPHGETLLGKRVWHGGFDNDTVEWRVVGLMQPIKMRNGMLPYAVRLEPWKGEMPEWAFYGMRIFVRAKDDVSEARFMEEFLTWADENLQSGSLIMRDLLPFHAVQAASDLGEGVTNELRSKYILAVFFLFNLLLAVSGTFWLNTRTRTEEMGIRLSYGASPGNIRRMLLGEATVLVSEAVLIGCFLYFHYAYVEGLYEYGNLFEWDKSMATNRSIYLISRFEAHFLIVSLLVYLVMLVATWLGVYLPARSISHISPVEALKGD